MTETQSITEFKILPYRYKQPERMKGDS